MAGVAAGVAVLRHMLRVEAVVTAVRITLWETPAQASLLRIMVLGVVRVVVAGVVRPRKPAARAARAARGS